MITKTTQGIKISVEALYQEEYSKPVDNEYVFAYTITIENGGEHSIQLLKRHWKIFDSNGLRWEVDGDGVVGKQPVLEPGERYQYISGCHLKTAIGTMEGNYEMIRLIDGGKFNVLIPRFILSAPLKWN